jgi:site-specific DNA recombinase
VAEEFDECGARLEFVTESFEDSAVGRVIRSAEAFAAEVEHEKIKERTMRGRLARAQSGKLIPGWKPLYGYQWADEGKTRYVVNAVAEPVVRRIFSETRAGVARRELARRLTRDGIPTPSGRGTTGSHQQSATY